MASTNFTNNVTLTEADWFDDVDTKAYSYLTGVAGTNTITATGPASLEAYAAGLEFEFIPANTNTGATTINITGASALGARNIFSNGAACVGGELRQNVPVKVIDDGTRFHILGNAVPVPFVDTYPVVVGSSDSTKKVRFEVDGLTTATTRVITVPDVDFTIATAGTNSNITSLTGLTGITATSTDAGATAGPEIILDRNSASPAASDVLGAIPFKGRDSGAGTDTYAQIQAEIVDPTAASEDGKLSLQTAVAGTLATRAYVAQGMVIGFPTGADKGAGTLNVDSGIYEDEKRMFSRASMFESSEQALAANSTVSVAHSLGAVPVLVRAIIRCKTAELGYSVGDEVFAMTSNGAGVVQHNAYADATNVGFGIDEDVPVLNRSTFAFGPVTLANWKLVLRAWY